jgi:hypothetical protein
MALMRMYMLQSMPSWRGIRAQVKRTMSGGRKGGEKDMNRALRPNTETMITFIHLRIVDVKKLVEKQEQKCPNRHLQGRPS